MEQALEKLFEVVEDPYKVVAGWKESTKGKVVGCFPMHIPEEIIYASGMLPVVLWRGNEPVTEGHAHVPPFNCGLTRSFVDDGVRGKLNFIDGMIFYRTCLQAGGLPFIIDRNVKTSFIEFLYLPANFPGAGTRDFLIHELGRFKSLMEEKSGQPITEESLNRSIEIYNKNRALLRKINDIRKSRPGVITPREMLAIVQSSMLMPKEKHNDLLESLLPELEKREAPSDGRKKVIIAGSLCQTPRLDILDLIDHLGMVVVDDDMYVGSRYFANDAEEGINPLESLATRYQQKSPPCPTKGEWELDWSDYLNDMVKKNQAAGVISLLIKFCPPHLCYYPDVKNRLADLGVPHVMLELEHEAVSLEQSRTKLQSFLEMIGGV